MTDVRFERPGHHQVNMELEQVAQAVFKSEERKKPVVTASASDPRKVRQGRIDPRRPGAFDLSS